MVETRKTEVVFHSADALPPVEPGCLETLIVTVERKSRPGKLFTFAAYYLNRYLLEYEDGCGRPDCQNCSNDHGDGCESTGWFELKSHHAYDDAYFPLLYEGDRVVEWAMLPSAPQVAPHD